LSAPIGRRSRPRSRWSASSVTPLGVQVGDACLVGHESGRVVVHVRKEEVRRADSGHPPPRRPDAALVCRMYLPALPPRNAPLGSIGEQRLQVVFGGEEVDAPPLLGQSRNARRVRVRPRRCRDPRGEMRSSSRSCRGTRASRCRQAVPGPEPRRARRPTRHPSAANRSRGEMDPGSPSDRGGGGVRGAGAGRRLHPAR
jgi:hypothetical protein